MCVGDRIKFIPELHYGQERDYKSFTGTVVYINEPHRYFTVKWTEGGGTFLESFRFVRGMKRDLRTNCGSPNKGKFPQRILTDLDCATW